MMQGESKECNDRSPLSGRPIEVLLQPRVKNAPAASTGPYVLHSHESYRSGRPNDIEDDPTVLERREKQIRYGKNTPDYDAYVKAVPKHRRERHMPRTPEKRGKFSRRRWDGMIKAWKKSIHKYGQLDDRSEEEEDEDKERGQEERERPQQEEEEEPSLELEEEIEFLD